MSHLLALLLSQWCAPVGPPLCSSDIGAVSVSTTVLKTSDVIAPTGLNVLVYRAENDPGAALAVIEANTRLNGYFINYRTPAGVPFNVTTTGEVIAGSSISPSLTPIFAAYGNGDGSTISFGCVHGATGCETGVHGSMENKSFHGAVIVGNKGGNRDRDGGLALQVFGLGKTHSPVGGGHTVLALDVLGNLQTYGGMHGNYLAPQDFPPCETYFGFDNPGQDPQAPGGTLHPLGMWGYSVDTGRIQLCTPTSAVDAGYESVCTDQNDACQLTLLRARVTALEARLTAGGF